MSLQYLLVVVRDRARALHVRQLHGDVLFLGALDAPLDVADRREVLVELPLVACAERPLEARKAGRDVIEHALLTFEPGHPVCRRGAFAVAEEAFEHGARVDLAGQRTGLRSPRHRHVGARVTRVTVAGEGRLFECELERCKLRVLAELPGRDLIGRDTELEVGAAGLVWVHARQPRGGRARVVAGAVTKGASRDLRQAAQHDDVLAERLERLHRRAELEVGADLPRRPHELLRALVVAADDAVRRIYVTEPHRRFAGGLRERGQRREHRIQRGESHRGAYAPQERPPRQGLVGDDHDVLIWNGVLFTIERINDDIR